MTRTSCDGAFKQEVRVRAYAVLNRRDENLEISRSQS